MSGTFSDEDYGQTILFTDRGRQQPAHVPDLARYLVVTKAGETIARLELGAEPLTIGRDSSQKIVLADTDVSRRHARVAFINDDLVIEDLGSTNGTFLDGQRLAAPAALKEGHVVRVGSHLLTLERRSRDEVERAVALERDLQKARNYVFSLLPQPLTSGAVLADWCFVPSAQLGGDAFGYYWLDPDTFVVYLLDVSGHGVGSAMHSVTVLNVLRQRALPHVDFTRPDEVLASLNNRFQMDSHNGLFFTIWYGVYRTGDRRLTYASAGHHAAYMVAPDRSGQQPIGTPALIIGAVPDMAYESADVEVPAGSTLYVFSDGMFEIVTTQQQRWELADFEPLLLGPPREGVSEPERLYQIIKKTTGPRPFDDDASLIALTFP